MNSNFARLDILQISNAKTFTKHVSMHSKHRQDNFSNQLPDQNMEL